MQCPDCGYVMSAFDKECPRCKNFTAQGKRSPTHLKPLPPEEAAYLVDTSQPIIPTKQTPPDKPAQMLSAELLACAVCGNEAVQKVSAICQSGTWVTQSKGQTIGMADDGYGHAMMVGGSSTTTSQGRTHLALVLAPPPRPTYSPIGGVRCYSDTRVPDFGWVRRTDRSESRRWRLTCVTNHFIDCWRLDLAFTMAGCPLSPRAGHRTATPLGESSRNLEQTVLLRPL